MIEKIGLEENKYISTFCRDFLTLIKREKNRKDNIVIAEIRIGGGATTIEAVKLLEKGDKLYIYDFEEKAAELKNMTEAEIIAVGNTDKPNDSYGWNLAKLLLQMKSNHIEGIFDVVYLDGAHSFIHDGITTCLLKELLKNGGYIIFDDLFWSYSSVLTVLYSDKPPCLIFHRTVLASIDVATGYASFSRLADEKLSCGVLLDIMRSVH